MLVQNLDGTNWSLIETTEEVNHKSIEQLLTRLTYRYEWMRPRAPCWRDLWAMSQMDKCNLNRS
jgi:hypothetical protein